MKWIDNESPFPTVREIFMVVVTVCVCIFCGLLVNHYIILHQDRNARISALQCALEQREAKIATLQSKVAKYERQLQEVQTTRYFLQQRKERVIQWILENSYQCSPKDAEKIIDNAMKTRHFFDLAALAGPESRWNKAATSYRGAAGVWQILPSNYQVQVLRDAGIIKQPQDLYDIEINAKAATHLWQEKLDLSQGNVVEALIRYRGGPKLEYVLEVLLNYRELVRTLLYGQDPPEVEQNIPVRKVRIKKGDTLWKLSKQVYGEARTEMFPTIKKINGLASIHKIQAGETLVFPVI